MTMPVTLTPEQDKSIHRSAVEFMMYDRDMGLRVLDPYEYRRFAELEEEIKQVFGPDALENSASYFTDMHASSDDIVVFAATEWERLKQIFAGVEL